MDYLKNISSLKKSVINENSLIFSPSRYKEIKINKNFKRLVDLIGQSSKTVSVKNTKKYYNYVEIGSINNFSGYVVPIRRRNIDISSSTLYQLEKDDIIMSTVRTYLGGIGIIDKDIDDLVASKALVILRNIKEDIDKYYIFGVMRTNYFIQQTRLILNASMYPRMDKDALEKLRIPFPDLSNHSKPSQIEIYISKVVRNILDKENQIKEKQKIINEKIENELFGNQNNETFVFCYPKVSEIKNEDSFSVGTYKQEFKKLCHYIENYKNGYFSIPLEKIKSGSTPKTRILNPKNKKYKWITPTIINDEGVYNDLETINMLTRNNINKNSILMINRTSKGGLGEYVGITSFYDIDKLGKGHHNQGFYRVDDYSKEELLFLLTFLNSRIMRKICAGFSKGAKMKEMKSDDFSKLHFPQFPQNIKEAIVELYYNDIPRDDPVTLDTYLDKEFNRNKSLGIFQLNMEIFNLRNQLEDLVDKIVNEEIINIDSYFCY